MPKKYHQYKTRNVNDIATYQCRTDAFKSAFFPWNIIEWNKIDIKVCSSSYSVFRNYLLKKIRPKINSLCKIYNLPGIKLFTCQRLGLSH